MKLRLGWLSHIFLPQYHQTPQPRESPTATSIAEYPSFGFFMSERDHDLRISTRTFYGSWRAQIVESSTKICAEGKKLDENDERAVLFSCHCHFLKDVIIYYLFSFDTFLSLYHSPFPSLINSLRASLPSDFKYEFPSLCAQPYRQCRTTEISPLIYPSRVSFSTTVSGQWKSDVSLLQSSIGSLSYNIRLCWRDFPDISHTIGRII